MMEEAYWYRETAPDTPGAELIAATRNGYEVWGVEVASPAEATHIVQPSGYYVDGDGRGRHHPLIEQMLKEQVIGWELNDLEHFCWEIMNKKRLLEMLE